MNQEKNNEKTKKIVSSSPKRTNDANPLSNQEAEYQREYEFENISSDSQDQWLISQKPPHW